MGQVIQFSARTRAEPPVRVSQPVALVHDNATVATSMAVNISPNGLRVLCDRDTSRALCLEQDRPWAEEPPKIDAHFMLPIGGALVKVDAHCRLAYVAKVNPQTFAMGLEFLTLDGLTRHHIQAFLREAHASS